MGKLKWDRDGSILSTGWALVGQGGAADWWGRIVDKCPALLRTSMPSQAEVPAGAALVPAKVQPVTFYGSMAAPQAGTETHDSSREALQLLC